MKKFSFFLITLTLLASGAQAATPQSSGNPNLSGDAARVLFSALIQADLKSSQVLAPAVPSNPSSGNQIVEQKVSISDLKCETAYTGVGIETGFCTAKDQTGNSVRLGSASAVAIMHALPDGFGDGALGHFTAQASTVSCEIDARVDNGTGSAQALCIVL